MSGWESAEMSDDEGAASDSYLRDLGHAVTYGLLGVLSFSFAATLLLIANAVADGRLPAFSTDAIVPQSTEIGVLAGHLLAYAGFFLSGVFFLTAVLFVVDRPLGYFTGTTSESANGEAAAQEDPVDSRVVVSVTTTEGIQRFVPDTECAECDALAAAVLATEFEDETPTRAVPLCTAHLSHHNEIRENRSDGLEVERFA